MLGLIVKVVVCFLSLVAIGQHSGVTIATDCSFDRLGKRL